MNLILGNTRKITNRKKALIENKPEFSFLNIPEVCFNQTPFDKSKERQ